MSLLFDFSSETLANQFSQLENHVILYTVAGRSLFALLAKDACFWSSGAWKHSLDSFASPPPTLTRIFRHHVAGLIAAEALLW